MSVHPTKKMYCPWLAFTAVVVFALLLLGVGCQTLQIMQIDENLPAVSYGTPQGVNVTAHGPRAAQISWAPPPAEEKVYRYRVERALSADGPFETIADIVPDKTPYIDGTSAEKRLEDSTTYHYRVAAIMSRKGPISPFSQSVSVMTLPPPEPPAGVTATATGSRAVTLKWERSPSEEIVAYRVDRTPAGEDNYLTVSTVSGTTCVDGGTPASTLKDSTSYLYRVIAINSVDSQSQPSIAIEVTTLPPPEPVKGLTATSHEVRCVPLKWEASPESDVVRYDIYQARDPGGPFSLIGSTQGLKATSFIAGNNNPGNLEDEGKYYYTVRAVNAVTAESADSEIIQAVTRDIPPEVSQITVVSARPREVPVSWQPSADTTVTGYELWRAAAGSDDWVQVARINGRESVNYLDRGGEKDPSKLGQLKDGTEYLYRIIAFNTANVRSTASDPVSATTKVIPATPVGLAATRNTAGLVTLTWQPNPEPDIKGYQVESSKRADDGFREIMFAPVSGAETMTATEAGLEPGAVRYYRVRARDNERLESEWCETVEGMAKPLPDAPTSLQAAAAGPAFMLTWQPPPQGDITGYRVWAQKRLFGWTLVGSADQNHYRLELGVDDRLPVIAVTAIDQDKLESEKSEPLKLNP
ncbi:MAG: fibronectin type III domain-containing protein [Kiritimatiellae bacterium]|nr:fibronectin type III domain-containing protein [Kiritimatiellia bacterium]